MRVNNPFLSIAGIVCGLYMAGTASVQAETAVERDPLTSRIADVVAELKGHGLYPNVDAAYQSVLTALVQSIDPQGYILSDAAAEQLRKRRAGIVYEPGFSLRATNETLRIEQIHEDSPIADMPSINQGDVLLRIDDNKMDKAGVYQAVRLLRQQEPRPVTLVTREPDGPITTQQVDRIEQQLPDKEPAEALPFHLGYYKINRLQAGTGQAVVADLTQWAENGHYGLLLDLRGADGDDLESVRHVAELFADAGSFLFTYRDRNEQDLMVVNAESPHPLGMPVMVLVDRETGGAAEVLAAVLSDSVRGIMVFGQETRGDLLLREAIELPDEDRALYLATRHLVTGDATVYDGLSGVRPDVITALRDQGSRKPVRSNRTEVLDEEIAQENLYHRVRGDATLRRAVDVLLGLKALDIRPIERSGP